MNRTSHRLVALSLLFFAAFAGGAPNPDDGDVRSLKVNASLDELSTEDFAVFHCADAQKPISSWHEFKKCTADDQGRYEVFLQYNDAKQQWAKVNDKWEGTKVAGHPVLLSVLIDDQARIHSIRAATDPNARTYMRKKAYLLSYKVKARYGSGWDCSHSKPKSDANRVGGLFIDEQCSIVLKDRRVTVTTRLYRTNNQSGKRYTNSTSFEISALNS